MGTNTRYAMAWRQDRRANSEGTFEIKIEKKVPVNFMKDFWRKDMTETEQEGGAL